MSPSLGRASRRASDYPPRGAKIFPNPPRRRGAVVMSEGHAEAEAARARPRGDGAKSGGDGARACGRTGNGSRRRRHFSNAWPTCPSTSSRGT